MMLGSSIVEFLSVKYYSENDRKFPMKQWIILGIIGATLLALGTGLFAFFGPGFMALHLLGLHLTMPVYFAAFYATICAYVLFNAPAVQDTLKTIQGTVSKEQQGSVGSLRRISEGIVTLLFCIVATIAFNGASSLAKWLSVAVVFGLLTAAQIFCRWRLGKYQQPDPPNQSQRPLADVTTRVAGPTAEAAASVSPSLS
jgi:hypothetical protein